uniref:Serpentine receptor class gamma n=1 Tax=Panagrellus redivivus TaxID=6233 RepID=A0A7E4UTX2_PANRE
MDTFKDYYFVIIPALYTMFSLMLSIYEIGIIIKARIFPKNTYETVFASAFYQMYAIEAVFRGFLAIGYFITCRLVLAPMFFETFNAMGEVYNFWTQFLPISMYYCGYVCQCINLAMTLNRFSAFWIVSYTTFWKRHLWWIMSVAIAVPMVPTAFQWQYHYSIFKYRDESIAWDHRINPTWGVNYSDSAMFLLTSVPTLILNVVIIKKIMVNRLLRSITPAVEIRLWILTAITFGLMSMGTVSKLIFIVPEFDLHYVYIMYAQNVIFDVTVLGPSWFLLWTSKTFRSEVMGPVTFARAATNKVYPDRRLFNGQLSIVNVGP